MGFAGQVPVVGYTQLGGDRPHSLSQASVGRHSTCRECLQAVQCMLEKAKTNTSLLSPKALVCLWQLSGEGRMCKSIHRLIHTSYLM